MVGWLVGRSLLGSPTWPPRRGRAIRALRVFSSVRGPRFGEAGHVAWARRTRNSEAELGLQIQVAKSNGLAHLSPGGVFHSMLPFSIPGTRGTAPPPQNNTAPNRSASTRTMMFRLTGGLNDTIFRIFGGGGSSSRGGMVAECRFFV